MENFPFLFMEDREIVQPLNGSEQEFLLSLSELALAVYSFLVWCL
jgi:hypothetical protein